MMLNRRFASRLKLLYLSALFAILSGTFALAQVGAPGTPPATLPSPLPDSDGSDERRLNAPDRLDISRFRGRPEYVVYGSADTMAAADTALVEAGAQLLRLRSLTAFDAELRVYDFQGQFELEDARQIMAQARSTAIVDFNAIYRFSEDAAPRLYASAILGDAGSACVLGSGVTLGMIDGPINAQHPALAQANVTVISSLLPTDRPADANHGTAVATLLVGEDSSGIFQGFASGARLIAVTAFAQEARRPGADTDRLSGALEALARARVDIINMSFSGPPNAALEAILADTAQQGVVLVGAAGNSSTDTVLFPAAFDDVIAVTAVDAALRRYRSASFGTRLEFSAPGVDVFVADANGGGRYASGTSFAAPIVAGLIARLQANGVRTTNAARQVLRATSRDLGQPGRDDETGWGLVTAPDC